LRLDIPATILIPEFFSGAVMPLSAVIVDDEQLARDELAYLLKNAGEVNVVAQVRMAWKRSI